MARIIFFVNKNSVFWSWQDYSYFLTDWRLKYSYDVLYF